MGARYPIYGGVGLGAEWALPGEMVHLFTVDAHFSMLPLYIMKADCSTLLHEACYFYDSMILNWSKSKVFCSRQGGNITDLQ